MRLKPFKFNESVTDMMYRIGGELPGNTKTAGSFPVKARKDWK